MERNKQIIDELNAVKAKQRTEEIEAHGRRLFYWALSKNKKKYNRKQKHKNQNYEV